VKPIAILLAVAAIVGCSDAFKPTIENVAGNYALQTLMSTDTAGTTDWMAAGATLTLSLATNATASGHLHIPGGAEGGGDLDADMAGTWTLVGGSVVLDQAADTFVRDMTWKPILGGLLAAERSFSGTVLRVQLQK
jgi:hypothetical protein